MLRSLDYAVYALGLDGSVLVVESCELIVLILIRLVTKACTEDSCQGSRLLVGGRNFSGAIRGECFYATGMGIGVVFGVSNIRVQGELYSYIWFDYLLICLFKL